VNARVDTGGRGDIHTASYKSYHTDDAERVRPADQRDDESQPRRIERGSPANRSSRRAWRWRVGAERASSRIPSRSALSDRRIADTELERAQEAAREFNVGVATADPYELIRRDDIDLIDVCTPSHTHFELAWAALEAGKHVLCEKPVAYDFRDTGARAISRRSGLKTKRRPDLPLQSGDALHARAGRRRLHRHAVLLQRLRAELAVARSDDAAASGRS
jgi:hypothetical protein